MLGSDEMGKALSLVTEELVMAELLLAEDWVDSFAADALPSVEPMADSEDGFISKLFPVDDDDGDEDGFSLLLTVLASASARGLSPSSFLTIVRLSIIGVSVLSSLL